MYVRLSESCTTCMDQRAMKSHHLLPSAKTAPCGAVNCRRSSPRRYLGYMSFQLSSVFVVQSCGRRRKRLTLLTLSLLTFSANGPHQPRSGRHLLPPVRITHANESPLSPFLVWKYKQIHPLSLVDLIIRHCEYALNLYEHLHLGSA